MLRKQKTIPQIWYMQKNFCLFVTVKRKVIVADSGGTKTDWCIVDDTGNKHFFSTSSYHPRMLDGSFWEEAKQFWRKQNVFDYSLFFFGAGCLHSDKKQLMTDFFETLGFKVVDVQSDLIGAGLALNSGNGWGAICGTGSVVFRLENGQLKELRGGLGRELGDEGSGYYFGKLVSKAIEANELPTEITTKIKGIEFNSEKFSEFSHLLSSYKNEPSIVRLHQQNFELFSDKYLHEIKNIGVVGSYAFYHQEIFKIILQEHSITPEIFLEKPINRLVDYFLVRR